MRGKVVHCFKSSFIYLQFLQSWVSHFLTQKTGGHHWISGSEVGNDSVGTAWTHRNVLLSSWLWWSGFLVKTQPPPSAHSCQAVKVFLCNQPPVFQLLSFQEEHSLLTVGLSTPVNTYILSLILSSLGHLSAITRGLNVPLLSRIYQPGLGITWLSCLFWYAGFPHGIITMIWNSFLAYRGLSYIPFLPFEHWQYHYISVEKKKKKKNYLSPSLKSLCCVPIHSLCVPVTFSYYLRKKIICPVRSSVAPLIRSNYVWK